MKRFFQLLTVLAVIAAILCSMVLPASAASMKTHIGIVKARGGLRLRSQASTSSSILATAHYGDSVVVISRHGDWLKVNYNLHEGYMFAEYLTLKERENVELGIGRIDGSVVNMRSGPDTGSSRVAQFTRDSKVEIFGFNCGWYKVKADGKIGYIRSDLVRLTEKPKENHGLTAQQPSMGGGVGNRSQGEKLATYAKTFVGYPYVYGGSSPSGFDCSGFVQYVCKQMGITVQRTATAQLNNGTKVSRESLQPGDLVFFGYGNTATHVGIYIGNNEFVHAQNSSTGVVITDLDVSYYDSRYLTARRVCE